MQNERYEIEVLEGEVVGSGHSQIEPAHSQIEHARPDRLPGRVGPAGVQTAMAAATGFVAGAATMALLRRYGQVRLDRAAPAPQLEPQYPGQTRTYVVHVRQLG